MSYTNLQYRRFSMADYWNPERNCFGTLTYSGCTHEQPHTYIHSNFWIALEQGGIYSRAPPRFCKGACLGKFFLPNCHKSNDILCGIDVKRCSRCWRIGQLENYLIVNEANQYYNQEIPGVIWKQLMKNVLNWLIPCHLLTISRWLWKYLYNHFDRQWFRTE